MKKVLIISSIILTLAFAVEKVSAQDVTSSSGGVVSVEAQAEQILGRLKTLQEELNSKSKKDKISHLRARKVKLLIRKLVRAVNSVPPTKCLERLKIAMRDFYNLVSEVGTGIACGPPIILPFLERTEFALSPDCIMPDFTPDQLDPTFVELNPIYDDAQKLSIVDDDGNDISDVCEGSMSN